jgi:hypothetical protein
VCINGWKKEYNGRLASQASSDIIFKAAGQYVCVDHNPTPLEGGSDIRIVWKTDVIGGRSESVIFPTSCKSWKY